MDQECGILPIAVSITQKDNGVQCEEEFVPLRQPGPHLASDMQISALSLFELHFDDKAIDMLITATLSYAEARKQSKKKKRCKLFKHTPLTKEEMMAFIGSLILLGIHAVHNYRKAWSESKAQVLIRLHDLMSCQRFELIGSFLHIVTMDQEDAMGDDPLRKIRPLYQHIKDKCSMLYQPLQNVSVERMVKSKARCHLVQYMKNKPVKWRFKYWVIADTTGYTVNFDLYTGRETDRSEFGLGYDVVINLSRPFSFQGYRLYVDNFYASPQLFEDLLGWGITAAGTLCTNRTSVPNEVKQLKSVLEKRSTLRGSIYYIRESGSQVVYVRWRDKRTVAAMSTAFPGHSERTVVWKTKEEDGSLKLLEVPSLPCHHHTI